MFEDIPEFHWVPGYTDPNNIPFETEVWELIGNPSGIFLDVGCGANKISPHTVGVDAYYEDEGIIKAYMWDMPFDDNSVDGIVCMAALEHIPKYQVIPTLNEFTRVLKPGARMIILVPNLEYVLKRFLENPTVQWEMDLIFGMQNEPGQEHRTGFTVDIVKLYFDQIKEAKLLRVYPNINAYNQYNLGIIAQKRVGKGKIIGGSKEV